MATHHNSESSEATTALKERTYQVLKSLVRSSYFGDILPTEGRLVQMMQMPRSAVIEALDLLMREKVLVIDENNAGYHRQYPTVRPPNGRVALLLNTSLFNRWYTIFQDYLIGFEETMRANGYEVIFRSDFEKLGRKTEAIEEFRRNGIRAIAFCSNAEPQLRQLVLERRIPAVVLGNATIHQQDLGCVCSDNFGAIREVVEFLLHANHRNIAYYTTAPQFHDGFQKRLIGYESTMAQVGLKPIRDLVIRERHSALMAQQACQRFLALKPRPTAIICSSDREAFELMAELQKSGLSVPDDVSITGFGNNVFGAITTPSLTSIETYPRDIGRVGANYLLNEIERTQLPIRLILPSYLVSRQSVRKLDEVGTAPINLNKKTSKIQQPEDEDLLDF